MLAEAPLLLSKATVRLDNKIIENLPDAPLAHSVHNQYLRRRNSLLRPAKVFYWYLCQVLDTDLRVDMGDAQLNLSNKGVLSYLVFTKDFEQHERDFVRRYLRPGDLFVDVGANIGLFTVLAADTVGPTGQVYAFEPSPETFVKLQKNIQLNAFTNVIPIEAGLSHSDGTAELNVSSEGWDGYDTFGVPMLTGSANFSLKGKVAVPTMQWDKFATSRNLVGKVRMIKIDVEGWESHVLNGGTKTLSRSDAPTLQVEFTDDAARSTGTSCAKLYRQLEAMGYTMCRYDMDDKQLSPEPLQEEYPSTNLFCTKQLAEDNRHLSPT